MPIPTSAVPTSQPLGPALSTSSDGSYTLSSYPITPSSSDNPPPHPSVANMKRTSSRPKIPRMSSMASIVSALSKRGSKASLKNYAPLSDHSPSKLSSGLAPLRRTLARRASQRPEPDAPGAVHEHTEGKLEVPLPQDKESSWKGNLSKTMKRMSINRWNVRSISEDQGGSLDATGAATPSWLNAKRIETATDAFPARVRASLDTGLSAHQPDLSVDLAPSIQPSSTYIRPLSTISTHSSASAISTVVIIVDPATLPSEPSNRSFTQPLLPQSNSDESVQSGESTYYDAPTDPSPDLSFEVFSPRVPPAPVLSGIAGNFSPISDLELPNAPLARQNYPMPVLPRSTVNSPAVLPSSRLPPQIAIPLREPTATHTDEEGLVDADVENRRPSEVVITPTEKESAPDLPAKIATGVFTEAWTISEEVEEGPTPALIPYIDPHAVSPKSQPAPPLIVDSPVASPDISRASLDVPSPTRAIPTPAPSLISVGARAPPSPRRTSTNDTISPTATARPIGVGRSGSVNSFTSSMIRSPITGLPSPSPGTAPSVGFQWPQGTVLPYIPGLTPATMSVRPQIYPCPTPPSLITSPKSLVAPIREPAALPKPPGRQQTALERAMSRRGSAVLSRLASPRGSFADLAGLGIRASAEPAPVAPLSPELRKSSIMYSPR